MQWFLSMIIHANDSRIDHCMERVFLLTNVCVMCKNISMTYIVELKMSVLVLITHAQ